MTEWVLPTEKNLDIWMGLLSETTSRDNFSKNSRAYYQTFLRELEKDGIAGLLFARMGDQVIAAGIFVYFSDMAIYYYGASTSESDMRKHMAPYLLQWEAMVEGKKRGCRYYDFLGVTPPLVREHHLS